jgi:hypothetical protein
MKVRPEGRSLMAKKADYQPPDGSIALLSLRAVFFERIVEIAPEIVDDFFQRLFDLWRHYPDFPPDADEIDRLVWRPPEAMLLDGAHPTTFQDKSGRVGFYFRLNQAVRGWASDRRIKADWCLGFGVQALRRYWTWLKYPRVASPASEAMAFVIKFMQGEHRRAWRVEVEEMRRSSESRRNFFHLFDPDQLARMEPGEPISTQAEQPIPPHQFPSRIDGNRILTRREYEQAVRRALTFEVFKWQKGSLSMEDSQRIGEATFKARKRQFDDYCEAFDEFLRKCGWVEITDRRALDRHMQWTVRIVVLGHRYEDLAKETGKTKGRRTKRSIKDKEEKAIRMAVIRMVKNLGLPSESAYQPEGKGVTGRNDE